MQNSRHFSLKTDETSRTEFSRAFANTRKKVQEVNNHNKKMEEDREGEGKILLFAEQLVSLHVKISVKKTQV